MEHSALEAIAQQYPDHPQTFPLLQKRAKNDPEKKLREWAKKKLGVGDWRYEISNLGK
ncbi:MAG: hypothetical protein F6K24_05815 [Okeania sp. SIO2D1]|nr:hypothetical protein [Okeania sp. SIO2D1]